MMRQSGGGSPQGLAQYPDAFALSGGGPNVGNPVNMQSGCGIPQGSADSRGGNNQMGGRRLRKQRPKQKQRGGSAMNLAPASLDNAFPATPQPSYGAANAFPESCYKAPGSELPVYNNNSAAFNFSPSITENNTLPPGVNVYNDVIQQPGRMGAPEPAAAALQGIPASSQVPAGVQRGGRRSRRNNRKGRKNSRKGSKSSRKH